MKHPSRKSLGFQLMLTARLHRTRMAMLLGEIGLFAGQEQALQVLAANDGATMGDLSRVLRVRPPTVSKTIARLSAQGLVERRPSSEDGRVICVHLTEDGRATLSRVDEATEILERELHNLLDDKDSKRLRKLLRRLTKGLAGIIDPEGEGALDLLANDDDLDSTQDGGDD